MIAALLLALALIWPVGTFSPAAEADLASRIQTAHPGYLIPYAPLRNLARWRAWDMVVHGYFGHNRFYDHLARFGVRDYLLAAEIIGWNNYPDSVSAAAVFAAFMASPAHRGAIVAARYDAFGVAAYKGPDGRKMYVVIFTDQLERVVWTRGKWLRASPWGTRLRWLPYGTHLTVFGHRRDSAGRTWNYVYALGRWGWVASYGTRSIA